MNQVITKYYKVADHVFCVSGEDKIFALMVNYEPFVYDDLVCDTCFALSVEQGVQPVYAEELRQEEEGQDIV